MYTAAYADPKTGARTAVECASYPEAWALTCSRRGGRVYQELDGKTFEIWAGLRILPPPGSAAGPVCVPKINASDLCAFSGRHPFKSPAAVIPLVVRRYLPDIAELVEGREGELAPTAREVAAALKRDAGVGGAISRAGAHIHKTTISRAVVRESAREIAAAAEAPLRAAAAPAAVKAEALGMLASSLQTSRGTYLERGTLESLRARGHVVKNAAQSFERVFRAGPHYFGVVGVVDGIVERGGAPAVCEIKNRVNGFRPPYRCSYDIDQLACYVSISGHAAGVLVEQYNGELKERWFTREELRPRWEAMLAGVEAALDKVYSLREAYSAETARELGLAN